MNVMQTVVPIVLLDADKVVLADVVVDVLVVVDCVLVDVRMLAVRFVPLGVLLLVQQPALLLVDKIVQVTALHIVINTAIAHVKLTALQPV